MADFGDLQAYLKNNAFMEKEVLYVAPMVDIIEVEVEKGFALSGVDDIPGNN